MPFEQARTQLHYGMRLRRARRRTEAREHLRAACETFTALGASIWAQTAHGELAAAGAPERPKREQSPWLELTAAETRVAQAILDGATYQEAATALFLSPKTIEAHLGRAYRKLGVRSRSELTKLLGRTPRVPSIDKMGEIRMR